MPMPICGFFISNISLSYASLSTFFFSVKPSAKPTPASTNIIATTIPATAPPDKPLPLLYIGSPINSPVIGSKGRPSPLQVVPFELSSGPDPSGHLQQFQNFQSVVFVVFMQESEGQVQFPIFAVVINTKFDQHIHSDTLLAFYSVQKGHVRQAAQLKYVSFGHLHSKVVESNSALPSQAHVSSDFVDDIFRPLLLVSLQLLQFSELLSILIEY